METNQLGKDQEVLDREKKSTRTPTTEKELDA